MVSLSLFNTKVRAPLSSTAHA